MRFFVSFFHYREKFLRPAVYEIIFKKKFLITRYPQTACKFSLPLSSRRRCWPFPACAVCENNASWTLHMKVKNSASCLHLVDRASAHRPWWTEEVIRCFQRASVEGILSSIFAILSHSLCLSPHLFLADRLFWSTLRVPARRRDRQRGKEGRRGVGRLSDGETTSQQQQMQHGCSLKFLRLLEEKPEAAAAATTAMPLSFLADSRLPPPPPPRPPPPTRHLKTFDFTARILVCALSFLTTVLGSALLATELSRWRG